MLFGKQMTLTTKVDKTADFFKLQTQNQIFKLHFSL